MIIEFQGDWPKVSKIKHIDIRLNDQLQEIDEELDAAMSRLEETSSRVGDVLTSYFNEGKAAANDLTAAAELDEPQQLGDDPDAQT